jgi:adenylate cyclase
MRRLLDFLRLVRVGLITGLLFLVLPSSFFLKPEYATYDARTILRGERAPDPRFVIVALDDKSRTLYSPSERDRRVVARLVKILREYGARLVALDITFPPAPPEKAPQTRVLAETLEKAGNIFIPVRFTKDPEGELQVEYPEKCLLRGAAGIGFINIYPDEDKVIRQARLIRRFGKESFLFLTFRALGHWENLKPDSLEYREDKRIRWGSFQIPLNASDCMSINFIGPAGSFPRVSLVDVLKAYDDREDPVSRAVLEMFRDKFVIVGATSDGFRDNWPVPFKRKALTSGDILMPGVEIQANILQTIISGSYIRKAPPLAQGALLLVLCMICSAVLTLRFLPGFEIRQSIETGLTALIIASCAIFGTIMLVKADVWFDIARPVAACVLTSAALLVIRSERIKSTLLTYVPGAYHVLSEMAGYRLEAHEKEITVVFFDIEGYTEMSSSKRAIDVFNTLKDLYGDLLSPFTDKGGKIITYLGDAAMLTFGAFKPLANHSEMALISCVQFKKKLDDMNTERSKKGLPELHVGIGICTGEAAIGILGKGFKEVSVVGNTTNTAARLQAVSKREGHRIIINEKAYEYLKDKYCFIRYENVQVKGLDALTLYGYEGEMRKP